MVTLNERWELLRYHPDHDAILSSSARFILIQAGRRSGKTEIAKRRLVTALPEPTGFPDAKYFFAAPTRTQAKEIAWDDLKALTPRDWMLKPPSETELKIFTKWGASLQVVGLDQPHRIEGRGYSGCVVDEISDVKPKALQVSIFPALADRNGWGIFSGVPKRAGVGAVQFNKMFDDAMKSGVIPGSSDRVEAYHWKSSTVLSEEKLAFFRAMMSATDFREQFEASRETAGGTVFHGFGEHNISPVKYDPEKPIIVGADFNVDPMCWVLCHSMDKELHQFGEVFVRNTNTPATLNHLYQHYGGHRAGWIFVGDASSRARKTAANATDYLHILQDQRFLHKRTMFPRSNPAILDRIASCNALFQSATGEVRYRVDPTCTRTITDLQVRAFQEFSMMLDDRADVGHMSDALGYVIHSLFPMTLEIIGTANVGLR